MSNRDRLVLRRACSLLHFMSWMEKGYIDKSLFTELRKYGSLLQGHPDLKKLPM